MLEVVATETSISWFERTWKKVPEGIERNLSGSTYVDKQEFFTGQLYDWLRQSKEVETVVIGDDLAMQLFFDEKTNLSKLLFWDKFTIGEHPTQKEWEWAVKGAEVVEAIIVENLEVFDIIVPVLVIVNSWMAPGLSGLGGKVPILKMG